jgi:acetoin utilization protein AcuB
MFAVYDATGRSFKDTLEELNRVNRIYQSVATRRRQESRQVGTTPENVYGSNLTRQAIETYRKSLPIREGTVIYHALQIMHKPVTTVRVDFTPDRCWELLWDNDISQAPVLNSEGYPVGMLSRGDLLKEMVVDGRTILRSTEKTIGEIMSPRVVTADPISDIRRIARVLYDYHFNALPITNDGDLLIGIVTRTDIVKAVATIPELSLWA